MAVQVNPNEPLIAEKKPRSFNEYFALAFAISGLMAAGTWYLFSLEYLGYAYLLGFATLSVIFLMQALSPYKGWKLYSDRVEHQNTVSSFPIRDIRGLENLDRIVAVVKQKSVDLQLIDHDLVSEKVLSHLKDVSPKRAAYFLARKNEEGVKIEIERNTNKFDALYQQEVDRIQQFRSSHSSQ